MKKLTSVLIALVLVVGVLCTLTACNTTNKAEAATVMNVTLNPEVEFVLDGNGKVLSVNALNEDGNLIITASLKEKNGETTDESKFEGQTAEEATKLFVELSHEMGFLVSGNVGIENKDLQIAISGEVPADVEKMYNDVKTTVEAYFTKENIQANVAALQAISKEKLQELVAQAQPYVDAAALSTMELVEQLYESRKETADMYSQEIKNAYYEAKAAAMDTAKVEALREKGGAAVQTATNKLTETYIDLINKLEQKRFDNLVSSDSAYQKALADFRAKKVAFLKYRQELAESGVELTEGQIKTLDTLQAAVDTAESALVGLGEIANGLVDTAKGLVEESYNAVMALIKTLDAKFNEHLDEVVAFQQEKLPEFTAEFEKDYATAVAQAKSDWAAMKDSLQPAETNK